MVALQSQDQFSARQSLAVALAVAPNKEHVYALLSASLNQEDPAEQIRLTEAALGLFPDSEHLWAQHWRAVAKGLTAAASAAVEALSNQVLEQISHRLPWVVQGTELRAMIAVLTLPPIGLKQIGFCRFNAANQRVVGWALNIQAPQTACPLLIKAQDSEGRAIQGQLSADAPHRLIQSAGFSNQIGGFEIRIPHSQPCLELTFADGSPLFGSPLAAIEPMNWQTPATASPAQSFKATNLSQLSVQSAVAANDGEGVTKGLSTFVVLSESDDVSEEKTATDLPTSTQKGLSTGGGAVIEAAVDVLIPVFEGREHTLACIQSVLAAKSQNQTPHEIVVLDDASRDSQLTDALQSLADNHDITLIRRPANLGFIRNINRGMALNPHRDVVWLNADTRVTGDWLDRLRATAYKHERIASATPWSNNAEAMSLAGFQVPSPMPTESAQNALDDLIKSLQLPSQTLVSGCGFCFYVKRQAIDAVGYLDEMTLIDGYGEETDWCMRARSLGWQHMATTNLFVGHEGGQSFGARKQLLAKHNNAIIRQRYPMADRIHDEFRARDPLKTARANIQQAVKAQSLDIASAPATTPSKPTHTTLAEKLLEHRQTPQPSASKAKAARSAIITDDLRDSQVLEAWLKVAKEAVPILKLLNSQAAKNQIAVPNLFVSQDLPASHLLEKAGLAIRIACPVGLEWANWLKLMGVTHQVMHQQPSEALASAEERRGNKGYKSKGTKKEPDANPNSEPETQSDNALSAKLDTTHFPILDAEQWLRMLHDLAFKTTEQGQNVGRTQSEYSDAHAG